jgi:hypothetical protein
LKKDWVVWGVCFGLFFAGGIYFNMLPEFVWKTEIGVADVVGGISAIAAAIAAVAASRAASIANKQSSDSAQSIRWQMYKMHLESFYEWLDGIEEDQGVTFYRRQELYDSMFPCNRNPALVFSEKACDEVFAWQRSFSALADLACRPSSFGYREIEGWISDYMMLTWHMKYSYLKPNKKQFFMDDRIASGVSVDNYDVILPVMSAVIHGLSKFSFMDCKNCYRGMTDEFRNVFKEFFSAVHTNGYHQHSYRENP